MISLPILKKKLFFFSANYWAIKNGYEGTFLV